MTNYNERIDKILNKFVEGCDCRIDEGQAYLHLSEFAADEAKQAITSLIKELVEEAKPAKKEQLCIITSDYESRCRFYRYGGYNFALDQFEQNLLKALEEK